MGTLATVLNSVRLRIKDQYKNEFTDDELIVLTIEVMDLVYETLRTMESNLVVDKITIPTVADVAEYPLPGVMVIAHRGVWIDEQKPLAKIITPFDLGYTETGSPEYYMLTTDNSLKLLPTPDKEYEVTVVCTEGYLQPTMETFDTYDFPWTGVWNRAILRGIVVECLGILERSVAIPAVHAQEAWDSATVASYNRGRIPRTNQGRLFDGI